MEGGDIDYTLISPSTDDHTDADILIAFNMVGLRMAYGCDKYTVYVCTGSHNKVNYMLSAYNFIEYKYSYLSF